MIEGSPRATIAIDYLPATTHAPGVGRYARELVRALVRLDHGLELVLLELGGARRALPDAALGLDGALRPARRGLVRRVRARVPRRLVDLGCRVTGRGVDRWLGADLVHRVLPGGPPVSRAPVCLPVTELPAEGSEAEGRLATLLARTDHLFVLCAHGAAELERRFGVPPERVHRVPVGCDHWRRELGDAPPRDEPPAVVVLGALWRERHPTAVLAGFEALARRGVDARLRFVGRGGDGEAELRARVARSPERARIAGPAPAAEAEMPRLLARASVLVHLSESELSAVTPLEACSVGTAVVASPLPAFREALGDHAEWALELDPERIADALERAIASARAPAERAARERLARAFTWDANARATVAAWTRILASAATRG